MKNNVINVKSSHFNNYQLVTLYFLILFLTGLPLTAQDKKFRVSISGGLNNNNITYSANNRVNTEYIGKTGNYFKAGFNFKVYKTISIQTGLMYLNKSYKFQRTGGFEGVFDCYTTRYFNIPVMVGIKPLYSILKHTKFNFELHAGAYVGWWNSLDRDATISIFSEQDKKTVKKESYDFSTNENHFNRVDYGLQVETRVGYNFYKNINIFIEYSFMYGLSDNQKNQLRKTSIYYSNTSNYGIGISYNF